VVRLQDLASTQLAADNFAVLSNGLTGASVTSVIGNGANYTVTVNTGTGDGAFSLAFGNSINVVDSGYNAVSNVGFSSPTVTIDRTLVAPTVQVNDGNVQRSMVRSLRVTFGEIITFVGAGSAAFQLTNNSDVVVPGVTLNVSAIDNSSGVSVVTITFSGAPIIGGSLADGRYRLRTLASQVRDAAGNALASDAVFNFHRFFGDINGDVHVDIADFGLFSSSIFNPANYIAAFDFNNDGVIDIADFGQFAVRIFTPLP